MALLLRLNYENYMHLLAYAPMPVKIYLTKGSDYNITCHILGKNMEWGKKMEAGSQYFKKSVPFQ